MRTVIRLFFTIFFVSLATGCVTTGTNKSTLSNQPLSQLVKNLPAPLPGNVNVVAYRKTTGGAGLFLDAVIKKDGRTIFTLANDSFALEQFPTGVHELEVSIPANLGGYKCYKSFFFSPNRVVFLKVGNRNVTSMMYIAPLIGHMIESKTEKNEKCAGYVEIYAVDEATAISDN